MSENIDALVYSSIRNENTNKFFQKQFMTRDEWKKYNKYQHLGIDYNEIDKNLTDSTIKRACCMQIEGDREGDKVLNYKVNVRLPIPKDYQEHLLSDVQKKYGYFDKEVKVPVSLCKTDKFKGYEKDAKPFDGQRACDIFYRTYCTNILDEYKKLTGADKNPSVFNNDEYNEFKPECGCFTEFPDGALEQEKSDPLNAAFSGAGCSAAPYKLTNRRELRSLAIQQCVQNVKVMADKVGGSANIQTGKLVNDCKQSVEGQTAKKSKDEETTSSETSTETATPAATTEKTPTPAATQEKTPAAEQSQASAPEQAQSPAAAAPAQASTQAQTSSYTPIIIGVIVFIILIAIVIYFITKKKQ
jgi:hypothetical protein